MTTVSSKPVSDIEHMIVKSLALSAIQYDLEAPETAELTFAKVERVGPLLYGLYSIEGFVTYKNECGVPFKKWFWATVRCAKPNAKLYKLSIDDFHVIDLSLLHESGLASLLSLTKY